MMRSTQTREAPSCRDWHDCVFGRSCQNNMQENGGKPVFFARVATVATGTTVFYNTRRASAW